MAQLTEKINSPDAVYFTLAEASKILSKGGRKPSTTTLWRWARRGCKNVRLQYVRFGRQIRVTPEALAEFGRALADADEPLDTPALPAKVKRKPRSESRRMRDIESAEAFLRAEGVLG